jgi:Arylsulfatase A and related enzymes
VYKGNWIDSKNNISSDVLGKEETTLAEVLLQNGFLTMTWIEQAELTPKVGFAQGFVEYNDQQGGIEDINNQFIEWINGIRKKQKFFAYIHYIDLHDPYRPKPPYDTMYGIYSEDVYSGINFNNWKYHLIEINKKRRKLDKKDVDQLRAYYDGLVTYIDSQIGLLLEQLKESGLYDNSLIILTADHGDGFMEHGFISHSNTPYEELIRVPLIIKFPNSLYAGEVVKSQVRLIDAMPTILDFFKIRINNNLEGFSLLNYLNYDKNKVDFPKYAYSENAVDSGYPTLSIRTEKFKFIHFHPNWGKKDELYDLSVDPKEQKQYYRFER